MTPTPPTAAQDTRQLDELFLKISHLIEDRPQASDVISDDYVLVGTDNWNGMVRAFRAARLSPTEATAAEPRPAVERRTKRHVAQVEIVGPSGEVHYRRPLGDPMIEEAICTPGYSVRGDHPAPAAPAPPLAETGLNEAAREEAERLVSELPWGWAEGEGEEELTDEQQRHADALADALVAFASRPALAAPAEPPPAADDKFAKWIQDVAGQKPLTAEQAQRELDSLPDEPMPPEEIERHVQAVMQMSAEPPPAGARGEKRWTQFLPFDLWADVVEAYESRNTDKLRGHIDAALADAEKRGAEKWISVSERLPEDQYAVLAYNQAFHDILMATTEGGLWYDEGDDTLIGSVTHWMPLPAPPAAALAQPVAGADAGGAK
jgi:hypothetical protein